MKRKKGGGVIFLWAGLLLLTAALVLTGYNFYEEYRAGKEAGSVLEVLQEVIPDTTADSLQTQETPWLDEAEPPDYILNPDMEMPVEEVGDNDYIGVLEIPSLGLSLPVMSGWDYSKLRVSPCRYSGSAYTGCLVIAAHNYRTHFGRIGSLASGAQVLFTDMKGRCFYYEVDTVEVLEPAAMGDLCSDQWDMALFTCTIDGQSRVVVRCLKVGSEQPDA